MRKFIILILATIVSASFTNSIGAQCRMNFNSTLSVNVNGFPDSLAAGDFNLDGKTDLAVVSKNLNSVSVLINQGVSFTLTASYDVGSSPSSIASGDFDYDGKIDLAVTNQNSNTFTILYGNGVGGFTIFGSINTLPQPSAITFADFNRDGGLDIAIMHLNSTVITVIAGDGTGGFLGSQAISHAQFRGGTTIAAADLNLDGKPDIIASGLLNSGGFDYKTLVVALGNTTGGFGAFDFLGVTGWVAEVGDFKIADLNRDGKPDIISTVSTTFQGDVRYTVARGNGTGAFPTANTAFDTYAFDGKSGSMAVGDFNGDGKSDIASTNPVQNKVNITLNTCGGLTNVPKADFDGDGKTDISIFRPSVGQWWYLKSSTGGNSAVQFGLATDKPVPGDFSGDGKTDIAFWRPSTGFWFILRSEDSTFYSYPFGTNVDIPSTGNYDGDGKTDAAIFRPSTSVWYINNSSGGTGILQFGQNGDIPVAKD